MESKWTRCDFRLAAFVLLLAIIFSDQVSGQFFTKSSKSIPRMGRRSELPVQFDAHRHKLLDALIDGYGPNLVSALEAERFNSKNQRTELYTANEQPMELAEAEYQSEQLYPRNMRPLSSYSSGYNQQQYQGGKPFILYGSDADPRQNTIMNKGQLAGKQQN